MNQKPYINNEPNSGRILSKNPSLFINNATNIFGSPVDKIKNIFPISSQNNIKKTFDNRNGPNNNNNNYNSISNPTTS